MIRQPSPAIYCWFSFTLPHFLFLLLWEVDRITPSSRQLSLSDHRFIFARILKDLRIFLQQHAVFRVLSYFKSLSCSHDLSYYCLPRFTFLFMQFSCSGFQLFRIICCFLKHVHSPSIEKAANHKEISLFFLFRIMCIGLLYLGYSERLHVAQRNDLGIFWEFQGKKKDLQILSECYTKYVFPLNSPTFHLAVLPVPKLVHILTKFFSGPSPMNIVVHGTSIQTWHWKKYCLGELKFLQCNYFGYKEFEGC